MSSGSVYAGEQQRGDVDALGAGGRDQLDARHLGHALVGDEDVYRLGPEDRQRLLTRRGGEDAVLPLEHPDEDVQYIRLVIDEKQGVS